MLQIKYFPPFRSASDARCGLADLCWSVSPLRGAVNPLTRVLPPPSGRCSPQGGAAERRDRGQKPHRQSGTLTLRDLRGEGSAAGLTTRREEEEEDGGRAREGSRWLEI